MSGYTDFYVSWEGCAAFGNTPSSNPILKPIPPPPVDIPLPLARFDFNKYISNESTIVNDISGGDPATINEPALNNFNTLDASNNYLEIYAPDNFPLDTGGVLAPSLSNVAAIEVWTTYTAPEAFYGQYFLDARTGASDSYWIATNNPSQTDNIGPFFEGATIYFNTQSQIVDTSGGLPTLQNELSGGWVQTIIVPTTTITDDIAFFMRFNGQQGMPVGVADIALYDVALTSDEVIAIYNDKCARYGLSPVPIALEQTPEIPQEILL